MLVYIHSRIEHNARRLSVVADSYAERWADRIPDPTVGAPSVSGDANASTANMLVELLQNLLRWQAIDVFTKSAFVFTAAFATLSVLLDMAQEAGVWTELKIGPRLDSYSARRGKDGKIQL